MDLLRQGAMAFPALVVSPDLGNKRISSSMTELRSSMEHCGRGLSVISPRTLAGCESVYR